MKEQISKCCSVAVIKLGGLALDGGNDVTNLPVCSKCGDPCEVMDKPAEEKKEIDPFNYPLPHPQAERITTLKREIDVLYTSVKKGEEDSRACYKRAYEALKEMGEHHVTIHNGFKQLTAKIEELEGITYLPLV